MDFRNRGVPQSPSATGSASASSASKFRRPGIASFLEKGPIILLLSVAIVIAALTVMIIFGGNKSAVIKDKYQAVFLNNGQVYFGNIRGGRSDTLNLQNIYYLQTSNGGEAAAAAASSNVSLVKLGCELHGPHDRMVINADQVLFWENLQDSSQVVKAIQQYQKDNPKGQTCSSTSQNSTQQAPTTTAPGTGAGATTPTPTPSTTAPQSTTSPTTTTPSTGTSR